MKKLFVSIGTLVLCCVILFGVSTLTQKIAADNARIEKHNMMSTLLPGSMKFKEEAYTGEDANIRAVYRGEGGYVIETAVQGYADEITMLVGVSSEGKVTGLVVRELSETVGLGAKALKDHKFLSQFLNTSEQTEVGTDIDAISGATVTSKAIAKSVNSAVAFVTGADIDSGATAWGG